MADDIDVLVAWTRTGQIIDRLDVSRWSYDDSVHWADPGSARVTVQAGRRGLNPSRTTLRSLMRAGARQTLVVCRNRRAVYAGPVFSPPSWDSAAASITAGSLNKLFDSRVVADPDHLLDPTDVAANVKLELSPRDRIRALLALGMTGTARDLPVTLPDLSGDEGEAVEYVGADLGSVSERIRPLAETGPDVMFVPQVDATYTQLHWNVLIGDPYIGQVWPDQPPTWTYGVGIKALTGDTDDSEGTTLAYKPGEGSGADRLIGVAGIDLAGDPFAVARERVDRTTSSQTRRAELDAGAAVYASTYATPNQSWEVTVHPDHVPRLGDSWFYGDTVRMRVDDHWLIEDGDYLMRVVGVSDSRDALKLTVTAQPARPTEGA